MELMSNNIRRGARAVVEAMDKLLPNDLAGFVIAQTILGDGDETTLALATKIVSILYRGTQKKTNSFQG
ncbi:MAG: hypothetical protein QXO28_03905 [Ignisphaera sp.]